VSLEEGNSCSSDEECKEDEHVLEMETPQIKKGYCCRKKEEKPAQQEEPDSDDFKIQLESMTQKPNKSEKERKDYLLY
jgi:hypothetical protein